MYTGLQDILGASKITWRLTKEAGDLAPEAALLQRVSTRRRWTNKCGLDTMGEDRQARESGSGDAS